MGKVAKMAMRARAALAAGSIFLCVSMAPPRALAWDAEGHKIVALIANHYLEPAVRRKIDAMLASDKGSLTKHDIADAATWADTYRDFDLEATQERFEQTRKWHSIDLELDHPDENAACYGHPASPRGTPASQGPADCILDKIEAFSVELSSQATSRHEKLLALKYLLNLVGDLHEPMHVSDDHNEGGDAVRVSASGSDPSTLRHYWDVDFLDYLGDDSAPIANDLISGITQSHAFAKMAQGSPADWMRQAYDLAKTQAYGALPPKSPDGSYALPPAYVTGAIETERLQLARAGVRLAVVLNRALARES